MSLFSSIQQANNSLKASQIGLQVVGQNIANANTPGYSREEVLLSSAPTQKIGDLLLGLGVQVKGVVQKIDRFLDDRLRAATSDRTGAEVREQAYLSLEGLLAELGETDISTLLSKFFASINEVANQPENVSVRDLAIRNGQILTMGINHLASRVVDQRVDLNQRVIRSVDDINRLTEEIATLNVRIANAEGGDTSLSDAVGLRDQRHLALTKLAELLDIKVAEQRSGGVAVFVGGEFLVFEGQQRDVTAALTSDREITVAEIQIEENASAIQIGGAEVGGLISSRDTIYGDFFESLNEFSETLAFEFNKVFSSGQGLNGFEEVTSEFAPDDADATLDSTGLTYTPTNGSFDVLVIDEQTNSRKTHTIRVDLNGFDTDMSLNDLTAALDAIDGISAATAKTGQLTITSDSPNLQFAFADDTSGILAALGINTFFTGTSALQIGVTQALEDDPALFAASRGGLGEDNLNALDLIAFLDKPLDSKNGATILVEYDRLTSEVIQGSTVTRSVAEGFRVFEETLQGQRLAVSGVSLDEEAIRMIMLQRTYQATARYISTLAELLDVLVSL